MQKKIKYRNKLFIFAFFLALLAQILGPGLILRCSAEEAGITVTDFAGLLAAVESGTGASIEIAKDIVLTSAITVGSDITIKAAQDVGKIKLTAAGNRHFNITGGDVTLTFDGDVLLDGGGSSGGINCTASSLTLNNAVIQNCVVASNGGGIFASRGVTVNGCVFSGNSGGTGGGGGIWSSAGLAVNNSTFTGNTALVGAGIYAVGDAAVYNSVFIGNKAQGGTGANGTGASGGGAVYARGSIVADNCTITGNTAGNGGGICSYQSTVNDTITVRNGTKIVGNQSLSPTGSCGGGAIYSTNSRVIIEGGEITGNSSVTGGGAIYSDGGLIVTGGVISGNTAATGGGAARVYGPVMSVSGGEISGNTAGRYGGAILTGAGSVTVTGGARIIGNTANGTGANDGGGGLSLYDCTLTVSGGEISGNTATHANGGGVGDYWGSTVNVTGGSITDNHAPEGDGGGIYVTDIHKVTAASGALFSGNTASRAFWMTDPVDIALHNAKIGAVSRSAPPAGNRAFTYLFNNYDVNYTKGDVSNPLPLFNITVTDDGNGEAGSDKSTAYQGETVTLTAAPHTGYKFREWAIVGGNIAAINGDGTFIMPDSDVVIRAMFEPIPAAGVTETTRITGNRAADTGYGNLTTIEEILPPLAGLPSEAMPNTGKLPETLLFAAAGILLVIFSALALKKNRQE